MSDTISIFLGSKVINNSINALFQQTLHLFLLRQRQVQRMSHDSLVDAEHVIGSGLEVAIPHPPLPLLPGGIIRSGDVAVIVLAVRNGLEGVGDLIEALDDVAEQVHGGLQLHLGVLGLHRSGCDGDVDAIGTDRMVVRDDRHVDICHSALRARPTGGMLGISGTLDLLGGDDDLRGLAIAGALHGVVQQTDRSHHLSRLPEHVVGEVRGVSHRERTGGRLAVRDHALDVALVVEQQLVGVAAQHEHAALDGAEARETLGKTTQAVHGIDVRRGTVLVYRVAVQLHRLHCLQRRLVQVGVV